MSADVFMQGMVAGLIVGLVVSSWAMLHELFGDNVPRLRDLGREMATLRALVAISRSADDARQQLLEEARRNLGRGQE